MAHLSDETQQNIIKELEGRGATQPCPRCGNREFVLVDGFFNQWLQPEPIGGLIIGGPTVPTVVLACQKCGFLAQHALGALGLLPQDISPKESKLTGR